MSWIHGHQRRGGKKGEAGVNFYVGVAAVSINSLCCFNVQKQLIHNSLTPNSAKPNSAKQSAKPLKYKYNVSVTQRKNSQVREIHPVIQIEEDTVPPAAGSEQHRVHDGEPPLNNEEILTADGERKESVTSSPMATDRPGENRKGRMRLRNLSSKNFGHYQLDYKHWLHMSGYRVAKQRRYVAKRSEFGLPHRRPIGVHLPRRRPMEDGLSRHRLIAATRPTKLLRLHGSDRPAIKSAGLAAASQAPLSALRMVRNVVDVETVDAAVSASADRGISDSLRAAIQTQFGARSRIKAGAKCRVMARRWTADDQLELLLQWEAGIVT